MSWEQDWESPSWCHHAHKFSWTRMPSPWVSAQQLSLCGPVPAYLPRSAYRSPHWGLPRSMPDCHLPFTDVTLRDIHFPCLSDLGALARHFTQILCLLLENISWGSTDIPLSFPRVKTSMWACAISAQGCADDALGCIVVYACLFYSPFPHMNPAELTACIALLRAMPPDVENPRPKSHRDFVIARMCHIAQLSPCPCAAFS